MRMLVVRPGAIGDSLLTFPILHALHMPGSLLTFVSNSAVTPLALSWRLADEANDYQALQWSELFSATGVRSLALRTLLASTDLAICWLRDPDGIVERNLRAVHIGRVIVTSGRPADGTAMHIVDYLAKTANINISEQNMYGWPNFVSARNAHGPIAIHPGSGGAHKCWPIASFALVIQFLWQHAIPVLLLAGPADVERIDALMRLLSPAPPSLLTLLFDVSLTELASTLQRCRGYLGNDSGITHLAALTGIPTLALFGPTDPRVWHPIGANVHVIYEHALKDIHCDRVMQVIEQYVI